MYQKLHKLQFCILFSVMMAMFEGGTVQGNKTVLENERDILNTIIL